MTEMQYLVSVIDDGTGLATPTEEADIDAFNDRLRADGHWVFAGSAGARSRAWRTTGRSSWRATPPRPPT
jgi:hypothetical protein